MWPKLYIRTKKLAEALIKKKSWLFIVVKPIYKDYIVIKPFMYLRCFIALKILNISKSYF